MVHSNWIRFFAGMGTLRVTTLLFDLGNVLFDLDIPATEKALNKLLGQGAHHFAVWARDNRFFERFETGEIDNDAFIGTILEKCSPETTATDVILAWNAMLLGMPANRLAWLEELRVNYQVALLSNTNGLHIHWVHDYFREAHALTDYEDKYFDRVYYSHAIGARKPNREAYRFVLQDLDVTPQEVLFIDDNLENCLGARQVGIHAVHHSPERMIERCLDDYLTDIPG